MKNKHIRSLESMILVSTPWALYSRPSIQIGTLNAYVRSQVPDVKIDAHHFYLKVAETIGYKLYHAISERTWLAETVYGALLFPERLEQIETVFYKEAAGKPLLKKTGFKTLINRVGEVSDKFINQTDWGAFGLAGFSICLCQLTSALYFIKHIKQKFPDLLIVVGGFMAAGNSIKTMFHVFPEIDVVINGEGELPLSRLVRHLKESKPLENIPVIPGIYTKQITKNNAPVSFSQMPDLSSLPPPDFDDYFHLLKTFSPQKTFFPTLSAEISRGCWWRKRKTDGKTMGCAFCNLNLQWDGYRSKHPSQIVSEIDYLTTKYRTLSVAFMDNLLPMKTSGEIFSKLGRLNKDLKLFGEIRASMPKRVLETMQAAGMNEVQIGIESLSTRLLKKLNKGTTAILNLEILKNCEALGIANNSNLILHFPGSDQQDVEETLNTLEFAMAFSPLRCVYFWLGLESPVWLNSKAFEIKTVFNHPNYAAIFPFKISSAMNCMIQAYRGDLGYQKKLWQPVKKKVRFWKKAYAELHKGPIYEPILNFRDGRDFLIIRQRRLNEEPMTHRLVGTSREIYLFCRKHRFLKRILDHFPKFGEDKITSFLNMMVDKKLMFEENGKYLSLAIHVRPEVTTL